MNSKRSSQLVVNWPCLIENHLSSLLIWPTLQHGNFNKIIIKNYFVLKAAIPRQTANRSENTFWKLNSSLSPICISYFHSSLLSPISTRILSYINSCYLTCLLNAAISGAFRLAHSNLPAIYLSCLPSLSLFFHLAVTRSSNAVSSFASVARSSLFASFRSPIRVSLVDLPIRLFSAAFSLLQSKTILSPSSLRMAKSITKYLLRCCLKLTIYPKRMLPVSLKSFETNLIKDFEKQEEKASCRSTSAFFGSSFRAPSFMLSFLLLFILIRKCK